MPAASQISSSLEWKQSLRAPAERLVNLKKVRGAQQAENPALTMPILACVRCLQSETRDKASVKQSRQLQERGDGVSSREYWRENEQVDLQKCVVVSQPIR